MNNHSDDTTKIIKRDSGALTPRDRIERLEESVDKLVAKLDNFVDRFVELKLIENRLSLLEKIVYAGSGLILASFITGVITLIWKQQP